MIERKRATEDTKNTEDCTETKGKNFIYFSVFNSVFFVSSVAPPDRLAGKSRMPWMIAVAAVLSLAGICVWKFAFDAYHFATVHEGVLYRDGIRTIREFEIAVRKAKPRTIVRLIDAAEQNTEPFVSEMAYCNAHAITVVELPIKLGGWPMSEQVDAFLNIATDPDRQPVIVHCAQGVRRTGMMVAAYQQSILGHDVARAKKEMLTFGHSQRTVGDVMKFIDVYDPKQRTLPTTLPVGKE